MSREAGLRRPQSPPGASSMSSRRWGAEEYRNPFYNGVTPEERGQSEFAPRGGWVVPKEARAEWDGEDSVGLGRSGWMFGDGW